MRTVTRGRTFASRLGLVALVALAAGACDHDPSGPGTFTARVVSPADAPVGAAVIELTGAGIEGFEAAGPGRIFTRTVRPPTEEGREGLYRVVVVTPAGSEPRFGVRVQDVAAGFPAATLVSLADTADDRIGTVGDHRIRWER